MSPVLPVEGVRGRGGWGVGGGGEGVGGAHDVGVHTKPKNAHGTRVVLIVGVYTGRVCAKIKKSAQHSSVVQKEEIAFREAGKVTEKSGR